MKKLHSEKSLFLVHVLFNLFFRQHRKSIEPRETCSLVGSITLAQAMSLCRSDLSKVGAQGMCPSHILQGMMKL